MIRRSISLTDEAPPADTSLVVTVMGPDRPGIVRQLSERAERFGANWAGSRMSNIAGEFAGMVHFEVPRENADALAAALRGLESGGPAPGDREKRDARGARGAAHRRARADRADRPGIVRELAKNLAERGVSIEDLHTEIAGAAAPGKHVFKVKALLLVENALSNGALRDALQTLADEMMVDIALDERANGP